MPGSEIRSGPAGSRSRPMAIRRRSSQGMPTPPPGACGLSQRPQRSGKRRGGDLPARDHLVGAVPAGGGQLLGGGHARRVAVGRRPPCFRTGRPGSRAGRARAASTPGCRRARSQQRLVAVVASRRHLAQQLLEPAPALTWLPSLFLIRPARAPWRHSLPARGVSLDAVLPHEPPRTSAAALPSTPSSNQLTSRGRHQSSYQSARPHG